MKLTVILTFIASVYFRSKPFSVSAAKIVHKCALAAARRNFRYFGIQHHGECWSGPTAATTYNRDGISTRCTDGAGLVASYFVYRFDDTGV